MSFPANKCYISGFYMGTIIHPFININGGLAGMCYSTWEEH